MNTYRLNIYIQRSHKLNIVLFKLKQFFIKKENQVRNLKKLNKNKTLNTNFYKQIKIFKKFYIFL